MYVCMCMNEREKKGRKGNFTTTGLYITISQYSSQLEVYKSPTIGVRTDFSVNWTEKFGIFFLGDN